MALTALASSLSHGPLRNPRSPEYSNAVHLTSPKYRAWATRVVTASALERKGIEDVWTSVCSFYDKTTKSGPVARVCVCVCVCVLLVRTLFECI